MPAAQGGNAVILERIESLRNDVCQLRNDVKENTTEQQNFRVEYEKRHAQVEQDVEKLKVTSNEHEKDITGLEATVKKLEETIQPLALQSKIIAWIGGAIGLSVIALIWAILTHEVILTIP